jgi:hypothetical protein
MDCRHEKRKSRSFLLALTGNLARIDAGPGSENPGPAF